MSQNIAGVSVEIQTKANTAALRQAIQDFRDGKISAKDLQDATEKLNGSIGVQNTAIRELSKAYRVQHFELLEGIKVLNSFHSVFSSVNQAYQTFILRSVEANQKTLQQQEAYDNLTEGIKNLSNEIQVLGADNPEVLKNIKQLETEANNLDSVELKDVIAQIENLKKATHDPATLKDLGDLEDKFKTVLDVKQVQEAGKKWQDFFGQFSAIASIVTSIGVAIPQIQKAIDMLKSLKTAKAETDLVTNNIPTAGKITSTAENAALGGAEAAAGGSLAAAGKKILPELLKVGAKATGPAAAVEILSMMGQQQAGGGEDQQKLPTGIDALTGVMGDIQNSFPKSMDDLKKSFDDFVQNIPNLVPHAPTNINVNFPNATIQNNADLSNIGSIIADQVKKAKGTGAK